MTVRDVMRDHKSPPAAHALHKRRGGVKGDRYSISGPLVRPGRQMVRIAVLFTRSLEGTGFATRIFSMLQAYEVAGYHVDVFHFRFPHEKELPSAIASPLQRYVQIPLNGARYLQHATLLPPLAWHCVHAFSKTTETFDRYDVVQAETSSTWGVARTMPARKRLVVLHDDDSIRMKRLATTAPSKLHQAFYEITARKYTRWQRTSIGEADRVWFVSGVELDRLAGALPEGEARLIPNGADDDLWAIPPTKEGSGAEVLFIGPRSYEANSYGLAWFLREVWPLVNQTVPGVHLRVVGVGWEGFGSYPGVSFVGWRDSLVDEYSHSRVAIAPLFAGGGTKLKVVEAMAAGRPVVASPLGVEGIAQSDGVRVREEPHAFASEVGRFLTDTEAARQAGASNRRAVDELRWSVVWDRAVTDLQRLVR